MLIVSAAAFTSPDGMALHRLACDAALNNNLLRDGWNGFNMIHRAAGRVGAIQTGFVPRNGGKNTRQILDAARNREVDTLYLLGADEIDTSGLGNCFVIYQGHHGDAGAEAADIIFPGSAYTEKTATYVNTEGRAQVSKKAVFAPGEARKTGRSSARFPRSWIRNCLTIPWRSYAGRWRKICFSAISTCRSRRSGPNSAGAGRLPTAISLTRSAIIT